MKIIKKIKWLCICLVLVWGINLSAQINTDSLESVLKKANKSEKLSILNTLSKYYLVKSPGKSIEYGSQAISIAEELQIIPEKINALLNIGNAYLNLGDSKQSLNNYNKALALAKSASLQKEIAQTSLSLGNYYNNNSEYDKALKYNLEALKIYKTLDDKHGISDSYHSIGIVYYYLGKLEKALEFGKNALAIREKLNDKVAISKSLNTVAVLYMNLNKNEEALEYYMKALKLMEELKSINDQSFALTNIGITYMQKGDYENAINYFLKSLALHDQFADNRNKSKVFVCLGITYTDLKNYDKAESYLDQGLSLAKKSGYLDMIALNYKYLADLYLMKGDYKKTLDYKNLFFDIKDSVFNDENKKRIAEFQIRIETDNTQREAELLKEKSNILLMFFIFIVLALIVIVIILYSRKKAKYNADIALNKLNFNNNLANISIEKLIFWNNCQNGGYRFAPKEIKLSNEINNAILVSKPFIDYKKIKISSAINENIMVYVDPIALNLILRYLLLNAIKYSSEGDIVSISASPKGEFIEIAFTSSVLKIQLDEISNLFETDIQQIVSNNENEAGENLGLALCKEFIEKSGGKIRVETLADKQVSFIFILPKKS